MQKIEDYLASLRSKTAKEYKTTHLYIQIWQKTAADQSFGEYLAAQRISHNTLAKHIRQARTMPIVHRPIRSQIW